MVTDLLDGYSRRFSPLYAMRSRMNGFVHNCHYIRLSMPNGKFSRAYVESMMNRKSERTAFTSGRRHRYANHRDSFTKVTSLTLAIFPLSSGI